MAKKINYKYRINDYSKSSKLETQGLFDTDFKESNISPMDTFFEKTKVTFQNLTDEQIQYYVDNYHPLDKAGSYGIQDWFAVCVKKIDGCFYNVMGMPLSHFYNHFTKIINQNVSF